ncbi:type II toxin-antitoxin system RelE/ParE family toxin [Rhizobium bangladeshense]|uniref:type II toxin-antitoxin system RelE/ParE family toxin n=1 Tax=Rhizobium bangladeshense TaxID=1138189 RepID=UPI001FEC4419|nr:type II toxin-antitoxin system RelE/ParE family toxin [Rhizobium bangladeshense]
MKQIIFLGSSNDEIRNFPREVKEEIGFSLYLAQRGDKAINAVALTGFGNAMVPEIIVDHMGDTYRSVYTVRFKEAVYVLHAFKKKSKNGRSTPKQEIDLVKRRLKQAQTHYEENFGKKIERKKNVGT